MSTEKVKSLGAFTRKYEHNYRTGKVPNADPARTHLNEELIQLNGQTYVDKFRDIMAENHHRPRSNAVLGVELVMTYNATEVDEDFDVDAWKEANIKWLKENFPEENLISAVMHRDEGVDNGKSAHLHVMMIPMYEGKLNCKHYFSGRAKLIELQDSYGKAMKAVGLQRGKRGSTARHEDIRKFYDALNKNFDDNLPIKEEHETFEEYYVRANRAYGIMKLKNFGTIKKLERKIEELKTDLKMARYEAKADALEEVRKAKKEKEKIDKERQEMEKKVAELKKTEAEYKEASVRLKNFNDLMEGLMHHPDKAFVESLGNDINSLIEWKRQHDKDMEELVANAKEEEYIGK